MDGNKEKAENKKTTDLRTAKERVRGGTESAEKDGKT